MFAPPSIVQCEPIVICFPEDVHPASSTIYYYMYYVYYWTHNTKRIYYIYIWVFFLYIIYKYIRRLLGRGKKRLFYGRFSRIIPTRFDLWTARDVRFRRFLFINRPSNPRNTYVSACSSNSYAYNIIYTVYRIYGLLTLFAYHERCGKICWKIIVIFHRFSGAGECACQSKIDARAPNYVLRTRIFYIIIYNIY